MKHYLLSLACIFVLTAPVWSQPIEVDGTAPPVQTGFKTLSQEELQQGTLLLFDGVTFFGWEAVPMVDQRPNNIADPSITIAGGEMLIRNPVGPLALKTPLFWSAHDESQAVEIIWKGANLPLTCQLETTEKTIATQSYESVPAADGWVRSRFVAKKPAGMTGTSLVLLLQKGEYVIRDIHLLGKGNKPLAYGGTDSAWNLPADDTKVEPTEGGFLLSNKGRLETKDQFDNFLLRLAFKTVVDPANKLETFCNSGVFFRSIPNSKLDGYECQVNNDPNEADRPKFLGNDTGSIFRRSAARRITDQDNQWTHLAIAADGLVLRTWVNGIPTVVWKDERQPDLNPRKGSRLEKGAIQLQGHDPWTKLYYRDFTLAD